MPWRCGSWVEVCCLVALCLAVAVVLRLLARLDMVEKLSRISSVPRLTAAVAAGGERRTAVRVLARANFSRMTKSRRAPRQDGTEHSLVA